MAGGEGRGGGRRRQDFGGGSDTQAVLWGRGTRSGRGRAGLAGSARSPAGLSGIGSISIPLGGFAAAGQDNSFPVGTVRSGLRIGFISPVSDELQPSVGWIEVLDDYPFLFYFIFILQIRGLRLVEAQ